MRMTASARPGLPPLGDAIDVRAHGARGDGASDDGAAFLAAIGSGGRTVTVPAGTWKVGRTLRLSSGTTLWAHPQARIVLADGVVQGEDDVLLGARDAEAVSVIGGIWDYNNPGNRRGRDGGGVPTGVALDFRRVRGLTLRDVTVRDPDSFFIRCGEVADFTVEHIRFQATHLRPNQDGLHLGGGCSDGRIRDLRGEGPAVPNDDILALNADDALDRAPLVGLVNAPIRRIEATGLSAPDCHTLVRLLSVWSPIEDVRISDISGGCHIAAINADAARDCVIPVFDAADPAFASGVGCLRRVEICDLRVRRTRPGVAKPLLDLRTRCDGLRLRAIRRELDEDAAPEAPLMAITAIDGRVDRCLAAPGTRLDGVAGAAALTGPDGLARARWSGALRCADRLAAYGRGIDDLHVVAP